MWRFDCLPILAAASIRCKVSDSAAAHNNTYIKVFTRGHVCAVTVLRMPVRVNLSHISIQQSSSSSCNHRYSLLLDLREDEGRDRTLGQRWQNAKDLQRLYVLSDKGRKAKRHAAKQQNHLSSPPPIFPGSNVRIVADVFVSAPQDSSAQQVAAQKVGVAMKQRGDKAVEVAKLQRVSADSQ